MKEEKSPKKREKMSSPVDAQAIAFSTKYKKLEKVGEGTYGASGVGERVRAWGATARARHNKLRALV